MITDPETNRVYFSTLLEHEHNDFFIELNVILQHHGIPMERIAGTADIWARDYMPIQVRKDKFIQFDYNPGYLKNMPEKRTISEYVLKNFDLPVVFSDLIIDGGNVIKGKNWAILSRKVIQDNKYKFTEKQITNKLRKLFMVDRVIWIPWQKTKDIYGHADGMMRYFKEDAVLVNDYSKEKSFYYKLVKPLKEAGLGVVEIPYNPYGNKSIDDAKGIYINFLQMENLIIIPVFNQEEDDRAMNRFQELFPNTILRTLYSNEIAEKEGVLNCLSWTIKV